MRISYGLFTAKKINPGQSKLPGLLQVLPQLWALVIRAASVSGGGRGMPPGWAVIFVPTLAPPGIM
jgi:hypothetical protein